MKKENIGLEIGVEVSGEKNLYIFCVDNTGKIRGWYEDGFRHYMSDYELWMNGKGLGKMSGDYKKDGLVSALDLDGKPLTENGHEITNLKVKEITEVDIKEMTKNAYMRVGSFKVPI